MCLTVVGNIMRAKVAEHDIPVYKVLIDIGGNRFRTPYMGYEGELLPDGTHEMRSKLKGTGVVGAVLPVVGCYEYVDGEIQIGSDFRTPREMNITEGIHSWKEYAMAAHDTFVTLLSDPLCNMKIYNAIIPKGAHYFEGTRCDIVSDWLVIGKVNTETIDPYKWFQVNEFKYGQAFKGI